jgi:outer membrane murein-binding lipoprotein Lpp
MPASYSTQRVPRYFEDDVVTEWPRRVQNDKPKIKKPSAGRRMVRSLARFFIAVLIGVGATLAWQSYGDEAKEIVRARAPSLSWLLPPTGKSPPDGQASPPAVVTSVDLAQQLRPVALELAIMRQGVDQLAATVKQLSAKQEKMAQDISILPAIEQDIREKAASPAQPRTAAPRKPPQQSSTTQSSPASPEAPTSGAPLRLMESRGQSAR